MSQHNEQHPASSPTAPPSPPRFRSKILPPPEWLAVLAAAIILIGLLLVKPVVGMADNGDFLRIMGTVGLDYKDGTLSYDDKYFHFFIREFRLKELGLGGYVTSSLVPVLAARGLASLFTGGTLFDMRVLAALYIALFLCGLWLVIRAFRLRTTAARSGAGVAAVNLLLAAVLVFLFTDIGYSAYYNSLFSEPVALIFLLLTLGFGAMLLRQGRVTGWMLAGFVVSAVFLITAKVQNAPVGVLLALLCWRLGSLSDRPRWKRQVRWSAGLLLAASIGIFVSLPKEIKIINEYQTVFFGVLKGSPTPAEDLRELGLPEKLAVNAGTNYFEKAPIDQHDPVFAQEYHPRFSHMKVALFYLKHPSRFYDKLEIASTNGLTIRPYYLGNYEQAEGHPSGAISYRFSAWSEFKHRVLPNKLWFIALVFVLYFTVLVRRYLNAFRVKERILLELFAFVGGIGLFQFVTPIIGDGEADLAKHLFGFNVSFDLMLASCVVWAAAQVLARRPRSGRARAGASASALASARAEAGAVVSCGAVVRSDTKAKSGQ